MVHERAAQDRGAGERAVARIGISGWRYPPWRRTFYPVGLPQRRELEYAAQRMDSVEVNGSFYSLQRPESYQRWRDETPPGFVFAVKGPRYVTHMLRLRNAHVALANFFASGILALGEKLGPVLWQLPERHAFDAEQLDAFLGGLPRDTEQAANLARQHDPRLDGRNYLEAGERRPIRHALEVRSRTFETSEAFQVLRHHGVALVTADSAGRWPLLRELTADFAYVRLHGDEELYTSGYKPAVLDAWAREIRGWLSGRSSYDGAARDVYVYFDNDAKVHAPYDAMALRERLADVVALHA